MTTSTLLGICEQSLSPDFIKQVKPRKKDYLEIASENCKKFNEEIEGTFECDRVGCIV